MTPERPQHDKSAVKPLKKIFSLLGQAVPLPAGLRSEGSRLLQADRDHARDITQMHERLQAVARQAGERLLAEHAEAMTRLDEQDEHRQQRAQRQLQGLDHLEQDCQQKRQNLTAIAADPSVAKAEVLRACSQLLEQLDRAHAQRCALLAAADPAPQEDRQPGTATRVLLLPRCADEGTAYPPDSPPE